jgi:hypothetical protein
VHVVVVVGGWVVVVGGWVVVVGGWVVVVGGRVMVVVGGRVVVVVGGRVVVVGEVLVVVELPAGADVDEACEWEGVDEGGLLGASGPAVFDPANSAVAGPPTTLCELLLVGAWLGPEADPVVPEADDTGRNSPQSFIFDPAPWLPETLLAPGREAETELPAPPRNTPTPRLMTAPPTTKAVPSRCRRNSPTPREATAATLMA